MYGSFSSDIDEEQHCELEFRNVSDWIVYLRHGDCVELLARQHCASDIVVKEGNSFRCTMTRAPGWSENYVTYTESPLVGAFSRLGRVCFSIYFTVRLG